MSAIADALTLSREPVFLVALELTGKTIRVSTRDVSVPSSGDDVGFEGILLKPPAFGNSFNLDSMTYSMSSISLSLANNGRIQDLEPDVEMDGGVGKVWIWTPGLTWEQVEENGLLFRGTIQKQGHDRGSYSIQLVEETRFLDRTIPEQVIDTSRWPAHRTVGGGGSVAGKPIPLVFGSWEGLVPMWCVETAAFQYIIGQGIMVSTDADYTAGTVSVWNGSGAAVGAGNYAFSQPVDGQGLPTALFDFTGGQTEVLTCSVEGLMDGSGEYTGTAGDVIERPGDIIHYLWANYTRLVQSGVIGVGSLKALRANLPGTSFAVWIGAQSTVREVVDRILVQCLCARAQIMGKVSVVAFEPNWSKAPPPAAYLDTTVDALAGSVAIGRTPMDKVCNAVLTQYQWDPLASTHTMVTWRDWTNDDRCEKSKNRYGARPTAQLSLPDVRSITAATTLQSRYLDWFAMRHDLLYMTCSWEKGIDVQEGDVALITCPEGPARDAGGWIEEPFMLLERKFTQTGIDQVWWRYGTE